MGIEKDLTNSLLKVERESMNEKFLFICYPKCTTCQKAQKWLESHGIAYELRNIKEQNPTMEELADWRKKSHVSLHKFFNTSGMLYKSLALKDRVAEMTDKEQLALLATDGMLVKRPLIIGDKKVLVGFKSAEWETLTMSN